MGLSSCQRANHLASLYSPFQSEKRNAYSMALAVANGSEPYRPHDLGGARIH